MNNLNFDDLVNMLENLKKKKGEECLICQIPITDNTSIKLICNHYYHEKCLNITNKFITCPYCNQVTMKKDIVKSPTLIISPDHKWFDFHLKEIWNYRKTIITLTFSSTSQLLV